MLLNKMDSMGTTGESIEEIQAEHKRAEEFGIYDTTRQNGTLRVFVDSSTTKACFVIEGQPPVVVPYAQPATVNEGEYMAIITALLEIRRRKRINVVLLTDSQLAVNQVKGVWQCNYEHLRVLRDKVRELARYHNVVIGWVPREENLAGKVLEGLTRYKGSVV